MTSPVNKRLPSTPYPSPPLSASTHRTFSADETRMSEVMREIQAVKKSLDDEHRAPASRPSGPSKPKAWLAKAKMWLKKAVGRG